MYVSQLQPSDVHMTGGTKIELRPSSSFSKLLGRAKSAQAPPFQKIIIRSCNCFLPAIDNDNDQTQQETNNQKSQTTLIPSTSTMTSLATSDPLQTDTASNETISSTVPSRSSPVLVSGHEEMNPSRRSSMEDCTVYSPPGTWDAPDQDIAYLGVYDGHGGRDMVEYLEHGLCYHVAQELRCDDDATILERLERAFLMADIHSKQLGVSTSGSTVAICLIKKRKHEDNLTLYAANAGDARIVLGHLGRATRLTKDHRPDDPEEVERIEKAGGFMFKGRVVGVLAITRSLGDHCMKSYVVAEPYCSETSIRLEGKMSSFVICACDGLWDVFQDQDAVDFVWKYEHERERIAEHLVNEAIRRGSTDNISAVVAWL